MKKQGIDRVLFPLATAILLGLFSGQAFAEGQGAAASEGRWQQDGNNWKYVDGNGQEKKARDSGTLWIPRAKI